MRTVGAILMVLGLLALLYGGFSYVKDRHHVDVGPLHATVDEKRHVNVPPLVGAGLLIAGIALLATRPRRLA